MKTEVDQDKVVESQLAVVNQMGGLAAALSMQTGIRLGLFDVLKKRGPLSSHELATHTGFHERWIREWLHLLAASGIVSHESGQKFFLTPEMALVVADRSTSSSLVGNLETVDAMVAGLNHVPQALKTGLGQRYDAHGPEFVTSLERATEVYIPALVDEVLPSLPGVVDKLAAGGQAADVGCGSGLRTIAMAKAYPDAVWTGYDNSKHALGRASESLARSGLTNLTFRNADDEPLRGDHSLDLVTFNDVVHDMAFPSRVLRAVHDALKSDGSVMVADITVPDEVTERLAHPAAPMMYGASMAVCMSSAMSEEGGEGLGTFGLAPSVLKGMAKQAGFTRFTQLDIEDPFQTYYEIKP